MLGPADHQLVHVGKVVIDFDVVVPGVAADAAERIVVPKRLVDLRPRIQILNHLRRIAHPRTRNGVVREGSPYGIITNHASRGRVEDLPSMHGIPSDVRTHLVPEEPEKNHRLGNPEEERSGW